MRPGLRAEALLLVFAIGALACARAPEPRRIDAGRLGAVRVFAPEGRRAALVFLFSDAQGFGPALDGLARRLASEGVGVVGVDLPTYLAGLAASDDGCHYLLSEIEALAHRLERELGYEGYRSPILAGIGAGGTLAYAALAQSPAATLAGALGVDPAPALATRVPLCAGAPATAVAGGFAYGPRAALPGFWRPLATGDPSAPRDPAQRLLAALESEVAPAPAPGADELADLPLIELPAAAPSPRAAVIYSGDGGWRDLDSQIGRVLAEHGTPVVGVDSLRYFWHAREPEEVASDLSRILRRARERWGASEFLLIGYSFGAGILPFAVNRLPEADRAAIVQVSLLGLEPRAPFEIEVSGWLGAGPSRRAPAVLPELVKLDLSRVQCFYGEEEAETLCRDPALAAAESVRTTGGHHFDGDYAGLARRILAGVTSRPRPARPRRPARRRRSARRGWRARPATRGSAAPRRGRTSP
jgi:type IV secretory pathway VirJ component